MTLGKNLIQSKRFDKFILHRSVSIVKSDYVGTNHQEETLKIISKISQVSANVATLPGLSTIEGLRLSNSTSNTHKGYDISSHKGMMWLGVRFPPGAQQTPVERLVFFVVAGVVGEMRV